MVRILLSNEDKAQKKRSPATHKTRSTGERAWQQITSANQAAETILGKGQGKNSYAFATDVASESQEKASWVAFNDSHLIGVADIDAQHRTPLSCA